jgi:hypothetical protein
MLYSISNNPTGGVWMRGKMVVVRKPASDKQDLIEEAKLRGMDPNECIKKLPDGRLQLCYFKRAQPVTFVPNPA